MTATTSTSSSTDKLEKPRLLPGLSVVTNNSPTINVNNVFQGDVGPDTMRQLENWAAKFKNDIKNNVFGTMNKHNVFSSKIPVRSY